MQNVHFGILGGILLTDEEIALKGVGQTEILMKLAQSKEERALPNAMHEAFVKLWKKVKKDDTKRTS